MKRLGFLKNTKIREIPWIPMLRQPRKTIRKVLRANPRKNVVLLGMFYGLLYAIRGIFSSENAGILFNPLALLLVLLLAPIFSVLYLHVQGGLTSITGGLLGGKGGWKELTAAFAYANIVFILSSILILALSVFLVLIGAIIGIGDMAANPAYLRDGIVYIFAFAAGIIQLIILIVAVSEAHKFSKWRALGSILLTGLIIALFTYLVVSVFSGVFSSTGSQLFDSRMFSNGLTLQQNPLG